ncbi:hypothetical protein OG840_20225 [Streptomyces sp. NBC_01764]|uniref:hypothetical protein n=1 Tax=Streptomyces sp. NBC_01764 TaxID=2975935 RepID=UPI00224CFEA0|nr:hypothetical protein [Streptomyces sp. NBC_01764]MCX4404010.1 hypothetical protein [Streptomyces sp. NBC_01764]
MIDIPLRPPRLHGEPGPVTGHSGVCPDETSTNGHSDSVAAQQLLALAADQPGNFELYRDAITELIPVTAASALARSKK